MRLEKLLGPAAFLSSIALFEYGYKTNNENSMIESGLLFCAGIGIEAYNNLNGKKHLQNLYDSARYQLRGILSKNSQDK